MAQELIQQLTTALREAVRAFNVHPRFRVQETNSYSIASLCDAALKAAADYRPETNTIPDTYQGWSNRETWAVGLHLNNTQIGYETCRAMARECHGNRYLLAERLSSYVVPGHLRFGHNTNPMRADILEAAIARIDFAEIADDFLED